MNATLKGLKKELGLRGTQIFNANLQDRLGYHLLLRRGYAALMAGQICVVEFGKCPAQKWASFPVLADTKGGSRQATRGQSYYAGAGLNKSLMKPEAVETPLKASPQAAPAQTPPPAAPIPVMPSPEPTKGRCAVGWLILAGNRGHSKMRRTLVSAAISVVLACIAFWSMDLFDNIRRTADLADLQAQPASERLELSSAVMSEGSNAVGTEPKVTWTVEPKRLLEPRVAVNTRDVVNGDPACIGGTVTFILDQSEPMTFSRPLSRIAGVGRCDLAPGQY